MMNSTPTEVEVLRTAKKWIETKGWFSESKGREGIASVCIGIATDYAHKSSSKEATPAILGFEDMEAVIRWNDAPERAKEEVLARLDERIAFYEVAA